LIKRTSKQYIQSILAKHKEWSVLDIGCGYSANENANVICDIQDLSNFYKDKSFVKLENKKLPFKDNQFDFVIASHVLEHVEDIEYFIKELERISKRGYIEVPTTLEDNLVFENKKDHLWHMNFDDTDLKLLITKKIQYLEPVLTVSSLQKLRKIFKSSLVFELYWENSIDYKIDKTNVKIEDNFSLLTLLRKFISKKIRKFISK
jgi:ubiquinone/menaquinone biosynthesis C-methylase UbiE